MAGLVSLGGKREMKFEGRICFSSSQLPKPGPARSDFFSGMLAMS
jgi:hypothetical protein